MLSKAQEKLVKALHSKKGREKQGLCLVEGKKVLETAGNAVEWTFTREDSAVYEQLVSTETPQDIAGIARIPEWSVESVVERDIVLVLDGVQDPGNVGAILRLCLGFDAGLVMIESADVTNPKVVRSSVGALFQVPWIRIARSEATEFIASLNRPVYRLEKRDGAIALPTVPTATTEPLVLIAGSEGRGVLLDVEGQSVYIPHNELLESLNVGHSVAIALAHLMNQA